MDKEQVQKALQELQQHPKRKFTQSYDLIINLKNLVIKSNPIDILITLHYPKGKKVKVAAFVDQQLVEAAQKACDLVIRDTEFSKYTDKKAIKRLAEGHDYFVAQVQLMPKVAATFGRVLGPQGKMPNPKLGCVIPPSANIQLLVDKLNKTVRLVANKGLNLQCLIGKEDQPQEQLIDNILTAYQTVLKQLPEEKQNIKNVALKLTMSKPVKI